MLLCATTIYNIIFMQMIPNCTAFSILNVLFETLNDIWKCITDIISWMITNKLTIHDDKTEFIIIKSPRSNFSKIPISIGQEKLSPSSNCKSLGVIFDEYHMIDTFINNTCRSAQYHLRNISAVCGLITSDDLRPWFIPLSHPNWLL